MSKVDEMQKLSGLEQVVLRNQFYQDRGFFMCILFFILIVMNMVLGVGLFYRLAHPAKPQYFAATADGRVFNAHPLSDPFFDSDHVVQWSANAISKVFALDFAHWRQQLTDASADFTTQGWHYFIDSVKKNNNLATLKQFKMVSSAKVTGAPQVIRKGVVNGRYTWMIQVPVSITYSSASKDINQTAMVVMKVQRMNVVKYPQRIAIDMLVVNQQAKSSI